MRPGRRAAPEVSLLNQGYQYLTESRFDQLDAALAPIWRGVVALDMPLRSLEVELGPSQCEFTFRPQTGLAAADTMVLFRAAAKQIARRHGLFASFMCRPALPNLFSSGWHLHQSLLERGRKVNAFAGGERDGLSATGLYFLGGLLAHAHAAAAFTTPTVNGYKRYRPYTLAPDRAIWARDNRGVMVRVLGGPGDPATHLENRVGEPAANPYLYIASQIHAGLDGIAQRCDPGPSADTPYETKAQAVPKNLGEALAALRADATSEKTSARASSTITRTSRRPSSRASPPRPAGRRSATSPPGSRTNISICFEQWNMRAKSDPAKSTRKHSEIIPDRRRRMAR